VEDKIAAGLFIRIFGRFEAKWHGKQISGLQIRKSGELLAYLVAHHNSEGEKDFLASTIADTLRLDNPIDHRYPQTAKALWHLRDVLAVAGRNILGDRSRRSSSIGESVVPRLRLEGADVDSIAFNQHVEGPDSESLFRAVTLYRGHLLQAEEWSWVDALRISSARRLVNALDRMSSVDLASGPQQRVWARHLRRLMVLPALTSQVRGATVSPTALRSSAERHYLQYLNHLIAIRKFRVAKTEYRSVSRVLQAARLAVPQSLRDADAMNSRESMNFVQRGLGSLLPAFLTTYVHRANDSDAIRNLILANRLVTLTGPGGIGKTRLAASVAEAIEEEFVDRVVFVSLAPIRRGSEVAHRVASAIGVSSGGNPTDEMIRGLRNKCMLLVVDNCEHVLIAAAGLVDALLTECRHLRILTTSRSALSLPGEALFDVSALAYPIRDKVCNLDELRGYTAIRLFVERMKQQERGFQLTNANCSAVIRICRVLDGMPLPICLAAARVAVVGIECVADELESGMPMPGARARLTKDQTIAASLDWGYRLLSSPEKDLLQRLSVFSGGWTQVAARSICLAPDGTSRGLDASLERLRLNSWIDCDSDRYRMLEPVRDYARQKLVRSGRHLQIAAKHCLYFVRLADESLTNLMSREQLQSINAISGHLDNIHSSLEWANHNSPELGAQLCASLWLYWMLTASAHEGCTRIEKFISPDQMLPSALRARLLAGLAALNYYQSDHLGAIRSARESLEIKREILMPEIDAICHIVIGVCTFFEWQDRTLAVKHLKEAVENASASGVDWIKAIALSNLAYLWVVGRALTPALDPSDKLRIMNTSKQSLEFAMATECPWIIAHVLLNHGRVLRYDGDEREEAYCEALRLWLKIGDTFGVLQCLEGLSEVATERGDFARAARLFGAQTALERDGRVKLAIHHLVEHTKNLGIVRENLGEPCFSAQFDVGRHTKIGEILNNFRECI